MAAKYNLFKALVFTPQICWTSIMHKLPVAYILPDLKGVLANKTSAILSAPPGAGKTTLVPPALLDEPWLAKRKIIMLEPRRLAARAAAARMASNLGENIGETVGYRTRLDTRTGRNTRIEVVTEGILTRMLQKDPSLMEVGAVIFDEFHERSIHADLGLALCIDSQQALRTDLRIIIMSATIDTNAISTLLENSPVIISEGLSWPVETRYIPAPAIKREYAKHDVERHVALTIRKALAEEQGSILVFLPGAPEIRRVERFLKKAGLHDDVIIAPLHSMLTGDNQDNAIMPAPSGKRKVVLATSIAETSLTIEGIHIVIDSGYSRVPRFNTGSGMTWLETVRVSKSSADQRRGRAGRTGPGICFRLWDTKTDSLLKPGNDPEILNADLTSLALELLQWGIKSPSELKWLNIPNELAFIQALNLLAELDALDQNGIITDTGEKMSSLGIHPRLAHMIIRGKSLGLAGLACDIAAILGERDFLKSNFAFKNSDMRLRVDALHSTGKSDDEYFSDASVITRVNKAANLLKKQMNLPNDIPPNDTDMTGVLLAFAYPDRIALRRHGKNPRFLLSGGKGAWLDDSDPLANEEFITVANLDGDREEAEVFLAAPIKRQELLKYFPAHIRTEPRCEWSDDFMGIISIRREFLGNIIISEKQQDNPERSLTENAFVSGIRKNGLDILPWNNESRQLMARLNFIISTGTDDKWPDASETALLGSLESWLMHHLVGISRISQISENAFLNALTSILSWHQKKSLDELAPTHIHVPSGSYVRLDYISGNIPVLAVRLQEMFGCKSTPLVAGNIPVILHLLSPAGRPVQVTRDIAGFWAGSYNDVKKELKGRYPKHYWPDNPMDATPTKKVKNKSKG
jgi:ATP-dependent helicase HrpB